MHGTRNEYKWVPKHNKTMSMVAWSAVQKDVWECASDFTFAFKRTFEVAPTYMATVHDIACRIVSQRNASTAEVICSARRACVALEAFFVLFHSLPILMSSCASHV